MRQNSLRVEPVDNQHHDWGKVLAAIFRTGNRTGLLLSEDGWLSSRQTVLAAFDSDTVVGHLCFRVEPRRCGLGRATVASRIDSFSVEDFSGRAEVEEMLHEVAEYRAKMMRCPPPRVAVPA